MVQQGVIPGKLCDGTAFPDTPATQKINGNRPQHAQSDNPRAITEIPAARGKGVKQNATGQPLLYGVK